MTDEQVVQLEQLAIANYEHLDHVRQTSRFREILYGSVSAILSELVVDGHLGRRHGWKACRVSFRHSES